MLRARSVAMTVSMGGLALLAGCGGSSTDDSAASSDPTPSASSSAGTDDRSRTYSGTLTVKINGETRKQPLQVGIECTDTCVLVNFQVGNTDEPVELTPTGDGTYTVDRPAGPPSCGKKVISGYPPLQGTVNADAASMQFTLEAPRFRLNCDPSHTYPTTYAYEGQAA